jgi:hypothetical protein
MKSPEIETMPEIHRPAFEPSPQARFAAILRSVMQGPASS